MAEISTIVPRRLAVEGNTITTASETNDRIESIYLGFLIIVEDRQDVRIGWLGRVLIIDVARVIAKTTQSDTLSTVTEGRAPDA